MRYSVGLVLAGWAAVVVGAQYLLLTHATTPGAVGAVANELPAGLGERLQWQRTRPLLVLAAHPQCPCLPATLGELQRVLRDSPAVDLRVLIQTPTNPPPAWDAAAAAALRNQLPAHAVREDRDGAMAAAFGLTTSGHLVLYATSGARSFCGGITAGRGHAGDNEAAQALQSAIAAPTQIHATTAVFGCPLRADSPGHDSPCCKPDGSDRRTAPR